MARQPQAERRALVLAGALDADRAAVQLDEMPHDRHAQAKAAVTAAHRAVGLPEPIEHERQEFRRDADAGIDDFNLRVAFDAPRAALRHGRPSA